MITIFEKKPSTKKVEQNFSQIFLKTEKHKSRKCLTQSQLIETSLKKIKKILFNTENYPIKNAHLLIKEIKEQFKILKKTEKEHPQRTKNTKKKLISFVSKIENNAEKKTLFDPTNKIIGCNVSFSSEGKELVKQVIVLLSKELHSMGINLSNISFHDSNFTVLKKLEEVYLKHLIHGNKNDKKPEQQRKKNENFVFQNTRVLRDAPAPQEKIKDAFSKDTTNLVTIVIVSELARVKNYDEQLKKFVEEIEIRNKLLRETQLNINTLNSKRPSTTTTKALIPKEVINFLNDNGLNKDPVLKPTEKYDQKIFDKYIGVLKNFLDSRNNESSVELLKAQRLVGVRTQTIEFMSNLISRVYKGRESVIANIR